MIFNQFNTSVDIHYVFDVFGGVHREIENLRAQVDDQYFQWKAANAQVRVATAQLYHNLR